GGGVVSTRDIIDRARNLSTRQLDVPCGYPHQPADWIETVNALVAEVDQLRAQIAAGPALAARCPVAAADAADPTPSQLTRYCCAADMRAALDVEVTDG